MRGRSRDWRERRRKWRSPKLEPESSTGGGQETSQAGKGDGDVGLESPEFMSIAGMLVDMHRSRGNSMHN